VLASQYYRFVVLAGAATGQSGIASAKLRFSGKR
jgi:hypothetical protein